MKLRNKILIGFLVFLLGLGVFSYFYVKSQLFTPLSGDSSEKTFEIKEGQGVLEIVDNLRKEGLAKNKWITIGYLKFKKIDKQLKAGVFLLRKNQSPVEVFEAISSGKTALKKITIIEGWTEKEIADYLDERGLVKKSDFLESAKKKKQEYDFLEGAETLEGYLFPDTYYIPYKSTADDIIKKMLDNFDKKLTNEIKNEINKQGRSIRDVSILASVVEKEVYKEQDRKIVAGLFLKRISQGKPLEADSTINYITGKDLAQPSYSDTRQDSLYNTYLHKGLPPGPICNPSLSSILAAVYPEDSPYLFYLNRQDTKETIFSETYEEHLENKKKYLK